MSRDLFAQADGVPTYRNPVYWDRRRSVEENLAQVDAWSAHYGYALPPDCYIDEAAILVPDPWHRAQVANQLEAAGWSRFNTAVDLVYTNPFGTRYIVEYHFFQSPKFHYRLEVMMLVEDDKGRAGFSPLHQSLVMADRFTGSVSNQKYPMPHLSFKPVFPDHRGYSKSIQHLRDQGCVHAMTCQSTYGVFGYFLGNETMRQIYIKPRINLRDGH